VTSISENPICDVYMVLIQQVAPLFCTIDNSKVTDVFRCQNAPCKCVKNHTKKSRCSQYRYV